MAVVGGQLTVKGLDVLPVGMQILDLESEWEETKKQKDLCYFDYKKKDRKRKMMGDVALVLESRKFSRSEELAPKTTTETEFTTIITDISTEEVTEFVAREHVMCEDRVDVFRHALEDEVFAKVDPVLYQQKVEEIRGEMYDSFRQYFKDRMIPDLENTEGVARKAITDEYDALVQQIEVTNGAAQLKCWAMGFKMQEIVRQLQEHE